MRGSSETRRRLKPEDRRAELLAAGERVVRRMGARAKIGDVTQAVGAARGTFYVYFPSWEDFLVALRDAALARLSETFEATLASQPDWGSLICSLPDVIVDLTLELEGLHAAAFHGAAAQVPADPRYDVTARLQELLEAGAQRGALRATDAAATAPLVYALLQKTADRIGEGADRAAAVAACQQLLLKALSVRPVKIRRGDLGRAIH